MIYIELKNQELEGRPSNKLLYEYKVRVLWKKKKVFLQGRIALH
jgi:hypothetical protein